MIEIALYQPDIPQNVGAAIRLCACLGIRLNIIEPCGFPFNDRKIKQAGMDYLDQVDLIRHNSWKSFTLDNTGKRLILMTTKSSEPYTGFEFKDDDILIAGRESSGVPEDVHQAVNHRLLIPMTGKARSLNIINATSMITGEALRQTGF